MPSKKKARGKARRAAKSRKVQEDGAVNGIDSKMQRLQITNSENSSIDDDDEDALLEAAINLAAVEKEELEAAAAKNSEVCKHGFVPFPRHHECVAFFKSFCDEYDACCEESISRCRSNPNVYELFDYVYEATKAIHADVWTDPDMMQRVASHFIIHGTNEILEGNYLQAGIRAMCSNFFEQWAAKIRENETQDSCDWKIFQTLCGWTKISELCLGDEHTIVSFCRKRITCKCLDDKYKEVKSIPKMGLCMNPSCSLPDNFAVRSKMLYCTQCCHSNYCSRECQVAHWPTHKKFCIATALRLASRKSRQKSR